MKTLILLVVAFLILLYINAYLKYKKRKSHKIDTVSEFRTRYHIKDYTQNAKDRDYIERDKFFDQNGHDG